MKPERKPWYAEELRAKQMPADLGWATQTCPMGWSVLGIQTTQGMPPRTNIPLHSAFTYTGSYIAFGDNSRRITLARFPCPSLDRLRKTYSGHCSPIKAVQFIDNCNRLVTCGVGDSSIVQWRVGQDPEVIVKPEVVKKPPVVLHGDVSSKSASWCAVCREVNCENPNHGGLETANAVKEMVAGGGSYRGDKEEGHGEAGIPQRPWEHTMLAPKGSAPKGFVASNADHPIEDLELEHVFGFQGSDRKCNAKILKTGEVIYTAGCNAIVSNNYTRKQRHFTQHQSPILSIAINDDKFTICSVSNGQLPSIFVWDSITMEVKHNLRNLFFTDFLLVTFAGHRSEKLLVVGNDDMHSLIIVDWDTETILKSSHSQVCLSFFILF